MDNISHSFAGLAVGELIHRSLPQSPDARQNHVRRRLLLLTCLFASNFPDLDLILTPLLPTPLGYLLHHRGHTHTILYALPQALLLFATIYAAWPRARELLKQDIVARKGFGLALLVGFALHFLMDYLNSYGIHPFHPFDSRWFYGDMVFIVEPFFWISFGVPLALSIQRRWIRSLIFGFLTVSLAVFATAGFLSWYSLSLLVVTAGLLGALQRRSGTRGTAGLILSGITAVAFVGLQSFASGLAKRSIEANSKTLDNASHLLDTALTPFPTNPLCWTYISIESNKSANSFRLRRGLLSLAPELVSVGHCPAGLTKLQEQKQLSDSITISTEETGTLTELRRLQRENCYFDAWLRFARAPQLSNGVASDLRFSTGRRENFSTIDLNAFNGHECPEHVPLWSHPRADLLERTGP